MGTATFSAKGHCTPTVDAVDAVGTQYAVGVRSTQCKKQYTVFQYAVGTVSVDVSAKRSTQTVDLANMGGGDLPLVQKGHCTPRSGYAVGTQYAVGVSVKRLTHTVDLPNIGGGDRYL